MLSTRTNNNTSSSSSSSSSSPFTATQWQELEHQALIYKYIVSGLPIPPQLLSPLTWGFFQVGFSKRTDPEPGRCRRTDGKKWRCAKEAYPDSKYCERHMHRGKNRSRSKPVVDVISSSNSYTNVNGNGSVSDCHLNPYSQRTLQVVNPPQYHNVFMDHSAPRQLHPDYNRYVHGVKEEDNNMQHQLSSSSSTSKGYYTSPQSDLQSFSYPSKPDNYQHQHQHQHCFMLGDDFKPPTSSSSSSPSPIKPLHQFFGGIGGTSTDQSWLDLASSSRLS
ncbi:Growth-regulating factor 5 [Linum grandiflorum]